MANSATKLNTARTIDGMPFDGSANIVHFGVCDTAADVAEKQFSLKGNQMEQHYQLIKKKIIIHKGNMPLLRNGGRRYYRVCIYYSNQWIVLTANARKLTNS